jgi:hypothetical protein
MQVIFCPFLTREKFAESVGVTQDVLEGWIRRGLVKTKTIGKRSLVDMRQWMDSQESDRSI